MIKVSKELAHLDTLPVSSLVEFQGNLKDLTDKNYGKLKRSLEKHGFFVPMFVWNDNGTPRLVDGHQRLHVCEREGWNINVPVVYIEAANRQEAKEKLLVISSQYGRINQEGYDEFTFDMPDVGEMVNFDALSFEFGASQEWEDSFGGLPDEDRAPFQQMTFTLHDTQAEQVKQALGVAAKMGAFIESPNENGNGNALARICETFITEHGNG